MSRVTEFLIRVLAFVRKELFETLRQPRLVALLVLGPFLILLIFGVGYTNKNRTLNTLIVIPEESVIREEIENFARRLPNLNVLEMVADEGEADRRLLAGQVDLVIVTPANPVADILAGEHPTITFQHREIDPIELLYVNTLERAYINALNREVLSLAADRGKEELADAEPALAQTLVDATGLRSDLRRGNIANVAEDVQLLGSDLRLLSASIGSGMVAFEGVRRLEGEGSDGLTDMRASLTEIEILIDGFDLQETTAEALRQQAIQLDAIIAELVHIQGLLGKVQSLDSEVVARPFEGRVANLSGVTLGPIDFFVPGTIALLLQHIGLTLAALSIVRERRGGSIELFRAAPLSSLETLLGKSISFFVMSGFVAATMTVLMTLALKTPMEGEWRYYAFAVVVLLYESLGLGFLISSASETDTQAVQYSMIVLLASIFFTGFFIALHRLAIPVYLVSALLPATWGTASLQYVMLRGEPLSFADMSIPLFLGTFYYFLAWWRTRRLMRSI